MMLYFGTFGRLPPLAEAEAGDSYARVPTALWKSGWPAMSQRRYPTWAVLGLVATIATLVVLAYVRWCPVLPRIDDWRWHRVAEPALEAGVPVLATFALLGLAAMAALRVGERRPRLVGAAMVVPMAVLAFVAQLLSADLAPGGYSEGLIALGKPGANRYHHAARGVPDLARVARHYARWMRSPGHKERITHPVGPLALFWGLNHVFANEEAAGRFVAWCERGFAAGVSVRGPDAPPMAARLFRGMSNAELAGVWLASLILPLAAALAVLPTYALGASLYGVRAGVVAAALCAAVPSLFAYSPGLDQLFPVGAATAWWLTWTAGQRRSPWRAFLAGLVVSLGLFFTLAFAVVAAWGALLFLVGLRRGDERPTGRRLAWLVALGVGGFVVPLAAAWALVGYDSLGVWVQCLRANSEFNAGMGRTYWKWLLANPVEFLVFLGVPVAVAFLWRAVEAVRAVGKKGAGSANWTALPLLALLLVLDLLGANRGEVSRLWMFLTPACAVVAGGLVAGSGRRARAVFAWLFALQAIQVVVFRGCLDMLLGMYRGLGG